jgi:translation initiation factor 2B subunit (eIF-2B alpha/beta/delta family)
VTDKEPNTLIAALASDNTSGAAEIIQRAGAAFSRLDESLSADDLIRLCARLMRAQPAMAPLVNLASSVIEAIEAASGAPVAAAREAVAVFLNRTARAAREAASRAAEHLIQDQTTVLTHSRSSIVVAAMVEASKLGKRFSVVATESRPLFEGRTLAGEMGRAGIPVTVIADAAAATALETVSLVLTGADRVTQSNVVNKIGTRMIALAARERHVPVHVTCDSSKFLAATEFDAHSDEHPSAELWPDAPSGIFVVNRYFEAVPLELISSIVTEGGIITADEAAAMARRHEVHPLLRRALAERI